MKKTCAVCTNIAPLYSRSLWYELASSKIVDYTFYSSANGFSGIRTIDINESKSVNNNGILNWYFFKNIYLGNILVYQSKLISTCLTTNYDAYILYGEMHSLSNWIAALICKIRGKSLLIWGHGLYGNEKSVKKILRILYYKTAEYHLVYNNRSRMFMIDAGFDSDKVFTVYNSLAHYTHKKLYEEKDQNELDKIKSQLFPNNVSLPVIIFIGRLTKEKKVSYLIEALSLSRIKGNIFNCLIVGGGQESDNLRKLSVSLGIADVINFYGPVYDEDKNSKFIMLSECCVSPGNVGLNAIHSLSLGTPVITHSNLFNQGPEAESVIQDKTGLLFEENNVVSLSEAIDSMILNKRKVKMEPQCIEEVRRHWNPENQARIFDKAVLDSIKK
jgi:glycosyltransferase involved in cell wall biosynthesis